MAMDSHELNTRISCTGRDGYIVQETTFHEKEL